MVQDLEVVYANQLANIEGFNQADVQHFLDGVKHLLSLGTRLELTTGGTDMILAVGTNKAGDLIDIQSQGGADLRQLIVSVIQKNNQAFQVYINQQSSERKAHPHLPQKVEYFHSYYFSLDLRVYL